MDGFKGKDGYSVIAIVGGGLAGLCFAIQAADKGYSVALFEKETYPCHKVCGEYISKESWPFLQGLGLNLASLDLPHINQLQVSSVNGKSFSHKLPLGGFGISRYLIDKLLADIAVKKGVQLFTATKVKDIQYKENSLGKGNFSIHAQPLSDTGASTNFNWEADVAIGSFGKRSNIDLQWKRDFAAQKPNKLNNYIGIKYHIEVPYPDNTIALHNFENGYCGMSKIEDNKSCLCYLTTAQNLKNNGNSIKQMEENILYKNPFLKDIFTNAHFLFPQPVAISQISFQPKTIVENHVLMAGDAAGMITPLCGNGMSMAMHASKLAFEQVDLFLQKRITREEMELQYKKKWREQFSTRLSTGRVIQSLFGGVTTSNVLVSTMRLFPFLATPLIKATHGVVF
ncbi:NAD(P)/FAD-dependent oxidoreductase [Parasediminibacterium sp. JCM 36343]|uniref:NAD(P)/FAD-dependent oxidoreductase n=1 Tax=Parasediminibacterium sp. JCM 36343 TaxID=3374279 RepID=UPI00397AC8EC